MVLDISEQKIDISFALWVASPKKIYFIHTLIAFAICLLYKVFS